MGRNREMKIIYRKRQTGRTSELIEECAKYNYAIIVAPTLKRAQIIFNQALKMGKQIPMPISFREFVERRYCGRFINAFLFDDLDDSLTKMAAGIPVTTVIFQKDGKEEPTYDKGREQ